MTQPRTALWQAERLPYIGCANREEIGDSNRIVAGRMPALPLLGITEQVVANYKFDFLSKLRTAVRKQGLNHDVFPELKP